MILPNGAWTQRTADIHHRSSHLLAKFLCAYLNPADPTYDFGCGNAFYLSKLSACGFKELTGIEGARLNNFLYTNMIVADLTKPLEMQKPGNVISLEVGEHLPPSAQETFMQTVTRNCREKLVFSWAEPGQPGMGHINCRNQNEVIEDVVKRGFNYEQKLTAAIRKTIEPRTWWFRRTLLIFERILPMVV